MIFDANLQVRFFNITGFLCIIMNSVVIYMILFKSGNIGSYRNYLLYFQIICFVLDLSLTIFVCPVIYFPALLGTSHGIFTNYLSISTHFQINILFILILIQICALLCSFIRKHQSVAAIGNKNILSPTMKYVIKSALHLPALIVGITFGSANLDKSEEINIAKKTYPNLVPILSLTNAEFYSTTSIYMVLTLVVMMCTFISFCCVFLFCYIQIIQMLNSHRQFMTAKTYAKHNSAVLSLVAQLMVLIIWLAVPIGLLLIDVIFQIEGYEVFCNLLVCLFCTHSIISTLVMMFTFPAFRRVIFCQEKPLFSPGTTVAPRARKST